MNSRLLVLEDEQVIRQALRRMLERNGYCAEEAESVEQAQLEFDLSSFDLVIADLRLPGVPGTEIIPLCHPAPVLIVTSYSSVSSAVEAMKLGAVDYIAKPFDHDELLLVIKRILQNRQTASQNRALKKDLQKYYPVSGMIGDCAAMQELFRMIHKVAATDATVLITGESGTGKELVARAVHEQSLRSDGPMISVNCASIPEGLVEAELFGHEKGAFTGAVKSRTGMVEAARGGSLFLDEIGELPMGTQAQLLRVLQSGEVRRVGASRVSLINMRLIAATHQDLQAMVRDSRFREDLYYRLRVVEVNLPPLRDRGEDILLLAKHFLAEIANDLNRANVEFDEATVELIASHSWPGNVRELKNAVERAVILAETNRVTPELLAIETQDSTNADVAENDFSGHAGLSMDQYFCRVVRANEAHISETQLAALLGISRKALWERRRRLGIPRKG